MTVYTPDRWVVVDLSTPTESIRKVFAGWYGGYADGDSWKLSSGITKTVEKDKHYEFLNESGSTYICHEHAYGMSGYMMSVFANWEVQQSDEISIRIVDKEEIGILGREPISRAEDGI